MIRIFVVALCVMGGSAQAQTPIPDVFTSVDQITCNVPPPKYSDKLIQQTRAKISSDAKYKETYEQTRRTLDRYEKASLETLNRLRPEIKKSKDAAKSYFEVIDYICKTLRPTRAKVIPAAVLGM